MQQGMNKIIGFQPLHPSKLVHSDPHKVQNFKFSFHNLFIIYNTVVIFESGKPLKDEFLLWISWKLVTFEQQITEIPDGFDYWSSAFC